MHLILVVKAHGSDSPATMIIYCFYFHQISDFLLFFGTVEVLRPSSSECK